MSGTINREVGKQGKGFRLQRLRAIRLLLSEMKKSDHAMVYAATEYMDDVYVKSGHHGEVREYAEGDKDYDPKKSFSFMSNEVTNSLISFLDCWIGSKMSPSLAFGFYTNVGYAREYRTDKLKKLGVALPDQSILKLLIERNHEYTNLLPTVKTVLIAEYKDQYEERSEDGYLSLIEAFNDKDWIDFLQTIDWQFDQEDEKELEQALIDEIKNCSFYSTKVDGKEHYILGALVNEFEKRQNMDDYLLRLVSHSEVKTVFLEIATENYKQNDPVHEEWDQLEPPTDKRNLPMKIDAVCKTYNKRKVGLLARKVSAVRQEFKKLDSRDLGSYRYRILLACDEKIVEILDGYNGEEVPQEIVDSWITQLYSFAEQHLEDKSKDYTYPLKSQDSLRSAVLELFDSCFLAFDAGDFNG